MSSELRDERTVDLDVVQHETMIDRAVVVKVRAGRLMQYADLQSGGRTVQHQQALTVTRRSEQEISRVRTIAGKPQ